MPCSSGHDPVVEQIGCGDGRLLGVELDLGHSAVGVDETLLVDPANTFDTPHLVGVLSAQVARMLAFDLSVSFLVLLGFLQGCKLALGENETLLGYFGLQSLQPLFEGLEVMPEPYRAHPARRDDDALLVQLRLLAGRRRGTLSPYPPQPALHAQAPGS